MFAKRSSTRRAASRTDPAPTHPGPSSGGRSALGRSLPVALLRAAHLRLALLITLGLPAGAMLSGRSPRETGLVLATALVGTTLLGWHNDLVDAARDRRHGREDKPVANGHLERSTLFFLIAAGLLLLVPLSLSNGMIAGGTWLGIVLLGMLTNLGVLRRTQFSYLPWMATFGLMPAFLSYGGWGGRGVDAPPTPAVTICAALLGIGVHLVVSLPGLVDDNTDGSRSFPLRLALRTGAPKLLALSLVYTGLTLAGVLLSALWVGLRQ